MNQFDIDCLKRDCHILRTDILMDFGKPLNSFIGIGSKLFLFREVFMQVVDDLTFEELVHGLFNVALLIMLVPINTKFQSTTDRTNLFKYCGNV